MPIEMPCSGCGQLLRVADEHAGKMASCPKCGRVTTVPLPDVAGRAAAQQTAASWEPLATANPFAGRPEQVTNPYAAPATAFPQQFGDLQPHRGGLILTLGILGILCCLPLGIVAWVLGSQDLKSIRAGKMDPSGQGLTQAGMVVGIVATILGAVGILLQIVFFAIAALAG
jgi:hypothetical protein